MENFQCCITNFVVIHETCLATLQQSLNSIGTDNLLWSCSKTDSKPMVLGEWRPTLPADYTPPLAYQREGIWLTLTSRKAGPLLHSLYSCGCLHRTSCHMIRYKAVQSTQLHSFSIQSSDFSSAVPTSSDGSSSTIKSDLTYAIYQINNAEKLGTFIWDSLLEKDREAESEFGSSRTFNEDSRDFNETDTLLPSHTVRSPRHSELDDPPYIPNWTVFMLYCTYFWLSFLTLLQALLETPLSAMIVSVLTRILPCWLLRRSVISAPRFVRSASLKDLSITCAYLCERSRLLWHCLYTSIDLAGKSSATEVKNHRKQWIFVYSRLIFICIDILFGVLLGLYLWYSRLSLLAWIHEVGAYVENRMLLGNLEVLNNAPYGIKFNQQLTERLSSVLGMSIVALSTGYNYFIRKSFEEYVIVAISFMGCFGFSFQMLFVVDVIRSLTVHISIIHMALSHLHYFQLKSLGTLFYLFQGKKKNYLKKRIDTLETNKSQVFFGTVYFTVLCFLFPTFAAYFFLFTMLQFCVVMLQAMLWSCSIGVKEFPWCEIYLYFRDPNLLSYGVRIDIDFIRSSQKVRETSTQEVQHSKDKKRIKKNLMKETLKRENEKIRDELVRSSSSGSLLSQSSGLAKVKFSDKVESFPIRHLSSLSYSLSGDFTSTTDVLPVAQKEIKSVMVIGPNSPANDAKSDKDENDVDCNSSVASDSSQTSTSSSSSEEIGWARSHVQEDGDVMMEDDESIFATENIWGSSEDVDEDLNVLHGESDPAVIENDISMSITDSPFSLYSSPRLSDPPLSPLGNSYVPMQHRATGSLAPISSCTTYLSIQPTSQPFFRMLFKPYYPYFAYWSRKESALRLLRGLVKGNPALDLQIIRAAVEISSTSLKEDRDESVGLASHQSPRSSTVRKTPSGRILPNIITSGLAPAGDPTLLSEGRSSALSLATTRTSPEVNSVARSPNVFDLWSLLLRTCNHLFTSNKDDDSDYNIISKEANKSIYIYRAEGDSNVKQWKLEKFLFCFLIFTISLCLLMVMLGLCYACYPAITSFASKVFQVTITAIKRSKVSNAPQKGIFDIAKVHSFFSHHKIHHS